jgi:hypothetical protein
MTRPLSVTDPQYYTSLLPIYAFLTLEENCLDQLERIAELAKQMPNVAMMPLSQHLDIEWLREAHRCPRKSDRDFDASTCRVTRCPKLSEIVREHPRTSSDSGAPAEFARSAVSRGKLGFSGERSVIALRARTLL